MDTGSSEKYDTLIIFNPLNIHASEKCVMDTGSLLWFWM